MPDKQGKSRRHPPPARYRWKPGQSGNPKGRAPKAYRIPDILHGIGLLRVGEAGLDEEVKKRLNGMTGITMLEAVMWLVYIYALRGNEWAVRFIADRTEGKPKDFIEFTDTRIVVKAEGIDDIPIPEGEIIGTD